MLKIIAILCIFLVSCSSMETKQKQAWPLQLDAIKLGDRDQNVKERLGKPARVTKDHESDPEEDWIYEDESEMQRGTVTIDTRTRTVTGVTVIPSEGEPMSHLKELMNGKFPQMPFEKAPLQRCQRDYVPLEVFYIQPAQGIIIIGNRQGDEVSSFTRTTALYATDLLRRIRECKR